MFSSNASQVSTAANYIEDVFSTYLYTGNGSTQTITNGIDLAGKGGLVWIKQRSIVNNYFLAHAATIRLRSDTMSPNIPTADGVTSFNSNGFSIGANNNLNGASDVSNVSWTFRKQAKFFDVVTWTGNGSTDRLVSHNLESVPGAIFVKATSVSSDWFAVTNFNATNYAIGDNNTGVPAYALNQTGYFQITVSKSIIADSSSFNVAKIVDQASSAGFDETKTNANGVTYVAYLFAHNAGGFGITGTDNVISCGSYTGTGVAGNFVSLGYEPQWILIKRGNAQQDWFLFDNIRGLVTGTGGDLYLNPNLPDAEGASGTYVAANATGFTLEGNTTGLNASGGTYTYIAIRRGPMKTPTSGTSVFSPIASSAASNTKITTGFPVDTNIVRDRTASTGFQSGFAWADRLRSMSSNATNSLLGLQSTNTNAQDTAFGLLNSADNTGFSVSADYGSISKIYYSFRRAPGFFDVVCYTGTGASATLNHNLGVSPEMVIIKGRSVVSNWETYLSLLGGTGGNGLAINNSGAKSGTPPVSSVTATTFTLNNGVSTSSGQTYVAYLFATVAGVSKVGSYTGTGTTKQIDCGFTGGARFVLIKRADSTGDWYVWDSARGIVAGNDPYLLLNSTAAEVTSTDYVDTYSAGFEISSTAPAAINANGGTFIFLAIA